jgi:glycosyltransferase involved in cell wall biosynthesis
VAYPLLTVSSGSAGGAEQVLWTLEREMAHCGAKTTVAASAGSSITGELFNTGQPCCELDDYERRSSEHEEEVVRLVLRRECEKNPFDLIHDMSGSFWSCAPRFETPVLSTLHLPRSFYRPGLFENVASNVSFNCVSRAQAGDFADLLRLEGVIPNGIPLDRCGLETAPATNANCRAGLLWLGRICQEKAPHLALDIAESAGVPITVAGQVYPFSYHREYFANTIVPRLRRMPQATLVESPAAAEKRRLLGAAQALLITSQAEETSSLVAMEAAASGTPVVAFARGALAELVEDGVTGFLVNDVEEAIHTLSRLEEISREACLRYAGQHFDSVMMAQHYAGLYGRILKKPHLGPQVRGSR